MDIVQRKWRRSSTILKLPLHILGAKPPISLTKVSDLPFVRFLVVVMSAYKQIRSQSMDILSDVDEEDFDRAFNILRPGESHDLCR